MCGFLDFLNEYSKILDRIKYILVIPTAFRVHFIIFPFFINYDIKHEGDVCGSWTKQKDLFLELRKTYYTLYEDLKLCKIVERGGIRYEFQVFERFIEQIKRCKGTNKEETEEKGINIVSLIVKMVYIYLQNNMKFLII